MVASRDGQMVQFDGDLNDFSKVFDFVVENKNSFLKLLTAENFSKFVLEKLVILIYDDENDHLVRDLAF